MKVIKPLTLGVLHKPFEFRGEKQLCVAALGFFHLDQPKSRFLIESRAFPKVLAQLPVGQPIDMVMPKGEAEFLVCGNAYSPTGKPVEQLDVGAQVGKVSKVIRVFGNRQWYYGDLSLFKITTPEPFTNMPLGYEKAFGNPDYSFNTLGQGRNPNAFAFLYGERSASMPNLEYPQQPVTSHRKNYLPASFGPMDIMWQQRSQWTGTYDQSWIEKRFPHLADDADMRLHNVAAEDQRIPGSWKGGEPFQLRALHPEHAELCGTLPDFRVKAMLKMQTAQTQKNGSPEGDINDSSDVGNSYQSLNMSADTVWFFPDSNIGVMIYRAVAPISDPDGLDVKALLLAYEGAQQNERSDEHYIRQIAARTDREKVAGQVLNEAALIPAQPEVVHLMRAKKKADNEAARKAKNERFIAELEKDLDIPQPADQKPADENTIRSKAALETPDITKIEMPEELITQLTLEDIADGGIDLSKALKSIDDQKSKLEEQRAKELKKLESQVDELMAEIGDKEANQQQSDEEWEQVLENASRLPVDLHLNQGSHAPDVTQLIELLDSEQTNQNSKTECDKDNFESLEKMQRAHKRAQTQLNKSRKRLSTPIAEKLGYWLTNQLSKKAPMAGRDLTNISAPGVNFSGVDLREVNFEGANLSNANFQNANLFGANFLGANLQGANFSRANLEEANLSQCDAQSSCFQNAQCTKMLAVEANFSGASFGQANLTKAVFNKAQLVKADLSKALLLQTLMGEVVANHSCWIDADMKQTVLPKAQLERADFSGASMERVIFSDVKASFTTWHKSSAVRSFFGGGSVFTSSSWQDNTFKTCGFRDVNLYASNCQGSTFYQCDFGNSILSDSDLTQAVLCRSLFSQANLQRTTLAGADLHQAICRGTDFTDADLSGANLVHTDMSNAVLLNTRLQDVMERIA